MTAPGQKLRPILVSTACLIGTWLVTSMKAQETTSSALLVEYVPASVLTASSAPTNAPLSVDMLGLMDSEEAARVLRRASRRLTEGERWEKFETEFGLAEKNPSGLKGSAELAKYQLDKTAFAMNEFVQTVQNALTFDYGLRPSPTSSGSNTASRVASSSIPFFDSVMNARFKSDIDLNVPRGRAFVGVRLVLPIGD